MIIGIELRHDLPLPSVRIYSDAPTSEDAIREIEPWARGNHFVPFPALPLARGERDGKDCYFSVACSDKAIAAAGHRIYAEQIGAAVEAANASGTVAIDVLSTVYAIAGCPEEARTKLKEISPLAVVSVLKIGGLVPLHAAI